MGNVDSQRVSEGAGIGTVVAIEFVVCVVFDGKKK
jgi:hypothetical protein